MTTQPSTAATSTEPTHRTALITGGSSGLGLECAKALLRSPSQRWSIIVAARNAQHGTQVVQALQAQARAGASVRFAVLDLGDLAQVRGLAQQLLAQGTWLDALVCNAGLQFVDEAQRTRDGFEATLGVNHLGHFVLVHELLPALNPAARVVVVASGTHDPLKRTGIAAPRFVAPELLARPELDTQGQFRGTDSARIAGQRRYSTSKLCNVYFAYELNRRLRQLPADHRLAGVSVQAFDPGLMPGTGLAREYPAPLRLIWHTLLPALTPLLTHVANIHTPQKSGAALAWLLQTDAAQPPSGGYFEGRKAIASSQDSYNLGNAASLWQTSERLTQTGEWSLA